MAKKNQGGLDSGQIIGVAIIAIGAIAIGIFYVLAYAFTFALAITPIVVPLVVLIALFVLLHKYKKVDKVNMQNNYARTDAENVEFRDVIDQLNWAYDKEREIKEHIAAGTLKTNKDGSISARSSMGQAYIGSHTKALTVIKEYEPRYETLKNLPVTRYKTARKHFSKLAACIAGIAIWLISLAVIVPQIDGDVVQDFKEYVFNSNDSIKSDNTKSVQPTSEKITKSDDSQINENVQKPEEDPVGQAIVYPVTLLIIAYLFARIVCWIYFSIRHKKPKV